MFCLNCGAETPPRAVACPVCQHDLGGQTSETSWTVGQTSPSLAVPVVAPTATAPAPAQASAIAPTPVSTPLASPASSGPSIGRGDLDIPGLPRDLYGRALLVTLIAMAADLLLPWAQYNGLQYQAAHFPLPAIGLVALLAIAAIPAIQTVNQRRPIYAALPLIIGGACLGGGIAIWVALTYLLPKLLLNLPDVGYPPALTSSQPQGVTQGPSIGLYLFMLGGLIIAIMGYQLFLAAASAASAQPAVQPNAAPTANSALAAPLMPVPIDQQMLIPMPMQAYAPGMPVPPPPYMPWPGQPLPWAAQPQMQQMTESGNMWRSPLAAPPAFQAVPYPAPYPYVPYMPAPAAPAISSAPVAPTPANALEEPRKPSTAPRNGRHATPASGIALPGSAAWEQEPDQPKITRHNSVNGWQRGPVRRS